MHMYMHICKYVCLWKKMHDLYVCVHVYICTVHTTAALLELHSNLIANNAPTGSKINYILQTNIKMPGQQL